MNNRMRYVWRDDDGGVISHKVRVLQKREWERVICTDDDGKQFGQDRWSDWHDVPTEGENEASGDAETT